MQIKSVPKDITFVAFQENYKRFFPISNEAKRKQMMAKEFTRLTGKLAVEPARLHNFDLPGKVKSESFKYEDRVQGRRKKRIDEGEANSMLSPDRTGDLDADKVRI